MLFALLDEHDPGIEERLRERHVIGSDIHAEIKRALGMGEDRMWEGILLTPRVRKIVKLAGKAGRWPRDRTDRFVRRDSR